MNEAIIPIGPEPGPCSAQQVATHSPSPLLLHTVVTIVLSYKTASTVHVLHLSLLPSVSPNLVLISK